MKDDKIITFDELYRTYTLKALNRAGTTEDAAKLLGVTVRTVYHWKILYGISWDPYDRKYVCLDKCHDNVTTRAKNV